MGFLLRWIESLSKAPQSPQSPTLPTPQPDEVKEPALNLEPAITLIKEFEGLRLDAYLDPVGVPTIGYGHTEGVKLGDKITTQRAVELLMQDLEQIRVPALKKVIKVPVTNNEFCALVSFAFNVGNAAFANSTLCQLLNAGESPFKVAAQFDRWVFAKGQKLRGLERRRNAEKALFLKPDTVIVPHA